ncbi:MAG TPA: hypothetical protein VF691_18590 [Cytophagaceae bacterium]|jgi:hypothetical protein
MAKNLFACLLLLISAHLFAQKVSIIKTDFEAEKVTIYYDLEGDAEGQLFDISLLSSVNNFSTPLVFVEGEAGKNIKVGKGKKIVWNAAKELMQYKGNITFEIKAILTHSPLSLNAPVSGQSLKRGSTYPIAWTGGAGAAPKIELQKSGSSILSIPYSGANSMADLSIPKKTKPGSDYAIKLTTANGAVSTNIKIKRKIPLALKIAPVVILGGVAAILLTGGNGNDGGGEDKAPEEDLPTPPPIK